MMKNTIKNRRFWQGIPPWLIAGAVIILVPIFVFWTMQNINKQKESTSRLLLEKGAALIRSFEAGARTGMLGMMGMGRGAFQLQKLLTETAQQPDIKYLIVTDRYGKILAHNDPSLIGGVHGQGLDLDQVRALKTEQWRQVSKPDETNTFEVFRGFSPSNPPFQRHHIDTMRDRRIRRLPSLPIISGNDTDQIIFVGLDMASIEAARREDTRHTVIMAVILLLIGFAGIVSLFLAQAYRSARTSLTRIKAFSDSVVENMPIGLVAIDADGRIASFNETSESVLQILSREIIGQRADEILPQQMCSLTNELADDKRIIEKEMDCLLADGRKIPLEVSISALEGENGIFLGYILLFRDLTEVQVLKREVERNRRLASLGRLAAGIAHEIRNPLSSIKGFATYFRDRYREIPEDLKTAEIMVQEVERLNRVIGQLLEFARPMNIQKRPASINTLIKHSLKMVEAQAREKNIRTDMNLSPHIEDVPVDQDRINQVLLNIYLNAIDSMEDGGTLLVDLSRRDDLQGVEIAVSDTGIGIKKENLVHIFDPYYTTKSSGTGLGLAIVHKIIEAHQGEVRVESEPGKGTTVRVILPMVEKV